ncbi:MAG: hypothetical protein JRG73_11705 [Deltaproteobacteria bacterium]|nr:hypothetical protein [Deltaproteobacteria bacterium]
MNIFLDILIDRLEKKGIQFRAIPGYIRSIALIIADYPRLNLREVDGKLQLLGWNDFELDDHTFQLVVAIIEDREFAALTDKPAYWFQRICQLEQHHIEGQKSG